MKITEFFNTDYVDYASYSNLRMIASLMDGQKNASRKVLHTLLQKNIKEKKKLSQLGSQIAEFTEYLHGNIDGVIVNLGQEFVGTNNIPLITKSGNYGTRFVPEASASRYIYGYGSKELFNLFKKEDYDILNHQMFEGTEIEPQFFTPNLPILLINGSEGVSSGFAQKILPRNVDSIKKYIKMKLDGKVFATVLKPHYNGFKGTIEQGENSQQWIIKGLIERKGVNKVLIKEVPIGYNLKSYLDVLDDLEDKKIIQSYTDKSEDDNFLFEVNILSKDLKSFTDEQLLDKLKLVKKVSENYTCMNENNKIEVFNSCNEILDRYIEVKLQYMQKRKDNECAKLDEEIRIDYSKYLFIKLIQEDKLVISKRKKSEIEKDLAKVQEILSMNGYDYLLNMSISSLTEERMKKLEDSIKESKQRLDELLKTSIEQMWLKEI